MDDHAEQRIHAATPRRRKRARDSGHVASSRDVSSLAAVLAGIAGLVLMGGALTGQLGKIMQRRLGSGVVVAATAESLIDRWQAAVREAAVLLLPILGVVFLAPLAVHLLQTGFLFRPANVAPDFQRIGLSRGLSRMFSAGSVASSGFGLLKIVVLVAVTCASLTWNVQRIVSLVQLEGAALASEMFATVFHTILLVAAGMLVFAVVDYGYQRWRYEQDLKMTHQELLDELRDTEGNPQLAARRRSTARRRFTSRAGGRRLVDSAEANTADMA